MFFSAPNEYKPCGMFTIGHYIFLILTFIGIYLAVKYTDLNNKKLIKRNIIIVTAIIWILEIIKVIFNFKIGNGNNLNTYIPLYYCSILLYAGVFSSVGKGFIKKMGDVFLATGGIVGGILFLIFPTTSITMYPMFHYISIQSFIYHGAMLYLGIIINMSNYIEIKRKDIIYYSTLLFIICVLAFMVNVRYGSNLMFISNDFPGTPVGLIYKLTGKFFTPVASLIQIFMPFYAVLGLKKLILKLFSKKEEKEIYQTVN